MEDSFIPLSVPNFKGNELKYVIDAVSNGWVSTAGGFVKEFEQSIANYVNTPGAVACQSGTAGLHIALILSGVQKDDIVIVPTLTFIAAVNPVRYIGAEPLFMDCDDSLCIDPQKLRRYCQEECFLENGKLVDKLSGRIVSAVIVVHVFGNIADMEQIMKIAEEFHLCVIEDATEALGTYYLSGRYQGKYAGTIGDIGIYSFNGNKIITTGGGGAIVSKHIKFLERAKHLTTQAKHDALYYTHDEVGYNYRMTNLQAALGVAQLEELEAFIEIKTKNYMLYREKIKAVPALSLLPFRKGVRSNHWFYSVLCEDGFLGGRDGLIKYLSENKVQVRPIWGLIRDQIPYQNSREYMIEKAVYYWRHIVNVPCSTSLVEDDIDHIIKLLLKSK